MSNAISSVRSWAALAFALTSLAGCQSEGMFVAELEPPAAHEPARPPLQRVVFNWQSNAGGLSGDIQTMLPSGELFYGQYYEITTNTTVSAISPFYAAWYGGPWAGPSWGWGGAWPYYGSADAYITHYSGRVVAMLRGNLGTSMRCHFSLFDSGTGMAGGGEGECQLSNGARITTAFPPVA